MNFSTKELNNKIQSILNTKKITKAMEMISFIKLRKIEKIMNSSRPYLFYLKKIIHNISYAENINKNIFIEPKKKKKILILIISTNRGLCGSLNTNLFKKIINKINILKKKKIKYQLIIFGNKGSLFFKKFKTDIIKNINNLGEKINFKKILPILNNIFKMYKNKNIDHIFIANNFFKNKLLQVPKIKQIFPFLYKNAKISFKNKWDYIYEPNSISLFNIIFKKYFFTKVYQSFLENLSCEQASRMVAMKNATDNSNTMIENLRIMFNKCRQFNVTKELNEIVSGASAIL